MRTVFRFNGLCISVSSSFFMSIVLSMSSPLESYSLWEETLFSSGPCAKQWQNHLPQKSPPCTEVASKPVRAIGSLLLMFNPAGAFKHSVAQVSPPRRHPHPSGLQEIGSFGISMASYIAKLTQQHYAIAQRRQPATMVLPVGDEAFRYAFMFPVATGVATSCQLAGIGGAALFSPVFLLIFPLLGPEYPLDSPAQAIASALLTEVFGFSSGLSGYARRGLVDWRTSLQFAGVSVPLALVGALVAGQLAGNASLLREVYAALMFSISLYLTFAPSPEMQEELASDECFIDESGIERNTQTKISADGQRTFTYLQPAQGSLSSTSVTAGGGFLTGLLGVGVGEVVLPQLVRSCCMPLPVAAGTSVATGVVTAAAAAIVQFFSLAQGTDGDVIGAIPWQLVMWTIPGVLIGGQLAPFLASRAAFTDKQIERFAAALFAVVGFSFAAKELLG